METPQQTAPTQTTMENLESPAPSTPQQGQQTSGQQPPSERQSGSTEVSTTKESLVGLSREQFQELLKAIPAPSAAAPAPEKTWTKEEFDKAFSVMQIDPAALTALGYDEERLPVAQKHYETLRDGIVRQALTMAEYMLQQRMEQIQQRFAPMEQVLQEQQMQQMKTEFFAKFPDLEGLEELCLLARDNLIKEGKKFGKREDAFQAVAEGARALVKKLTGGAATAAGNGKPATTGPSTVSAGGQGGIGSAGATGGKKPAWQSALE